MLFRLTPLHWTAYFMAHSTPMALLIAPGCTLEAGDDEGRMLPGLAESNKKVRSHDILKGLRAAS